MKRFFAVLLLLGMTRLPVLAADDSAKAKDSYLQKADKEIQDWTAKIKSLQERSETSGIQTRDKLDRHLKALNENLQVARKKLEELRGSGENAWKSLREGLERTLNEVKGHYEKTVVAVRPTPSPAKK